MKLSTPRPWSD